MKRLEKNSDTGYRITDSGEGYYYIYLSDEKSNECRHYEYSGTYDTMDEVEKYLETHDYKTIVKRFREMYVYCECAERLY